MPDQAAFNSLLKGIPNKPPKHSYTNFVVDDETGCWLCPKCPCPTDGPPEWALKLRGYQGIPEQYPRTILEVYNTEKLYFKNPACVARCQNGWNEGLSGSQCDFDRKIAEGFRYLVLEKKYDKMIGKWFGQCSWCSVDSRIVDKNESGRDKYILQCEVYNEGYIRFRESPWHGKPSFIRCFNYVGTEKSLRCETNQWGYPGQQNSQCPGSYGGPIAFWTPKRDQDTDSLEWYLKAWKPGPSWQDDVDDAAKEGYTAADYDDFANYSSSWNTSAS